MNERQLALVSLFLALLGLGMMLLSSKGMKAREATISELGSLQGQYVEVSGFVSSIRQNNGNYFITICSGDCVPVVIFSRTAKGMESPNPYLIAKGDRLTVRGEAQEYGGGPEIVVLREDDVEEG